MKMTMKPGQALGRFHADIKKAGHPVKMASLGIRYNLKPSRKSLDNPPA